MTAEEYVDKAIEKLNEKHSVEWCNAIDLKKFDIGNLKYCVYGQMKKAGLLLPLYSFDDFMRELGLRGTGVFGNPEVNLIWKDKIKEIQRTLHGGR